MRDRIVDFILLAALILIAAIIVWTLFGNSFRRDVRPVTTPPRSNDVLVIPSDDALVPPPVETDMQTQDNLEEDLGTVQPVALEDPSDDTQVDTVNALPIQDDAEENNLESDVAEGDVTAVALDDEPALVEDEQPLDEPLSEANPEETAEPARTLAAGSFDLERIGFSYVTGGPGSCGIVLESWTHVAVSSDILADYPCGSEITVTIDETVGGRDSFTAIVGDTMNPANSQTVNIYVGEDEPALEYGVRTGTLEP